MNKKERSKFSRMLSNIPKELAEARGNLREKLWVVFVFGGAIIAIVGLIIFADFDHSNFRHFEDFMASDIERNGIGDAIFTRSMLYVGLFFIFYHPLYFINFLRVDGKEKHRYYNFFSAGVSIAIIANGCSILSATFIDSIAAFVRAVDTTTWNGWLLLLGIGAFGLLAFVGFAGLIWEEKSAIERESQSALRERQ